MSYGPLNFSYICILSGTSWGYSSPSVIFLVGIYSRQSEVYILITVGIYRILNPFPHKTILQQTTLNVFCQNIENLHNWMDNLWRKAENIVAKGEIALHIFKCLQSIIFCNNCRVFWSSPTYISLMTHPNPMLWVLKWIVSELPQHRVWVSNKGFEFEIPVLTWSRAL